MWPCEVGISKRQTFTCKECDHMPLKVPHLFVLCSQHGLQYNSAFLYRGRPQNLLALSLQPYMAGTLMPKITTEITNGCTLPNMEYRNYPLIQTRQTSLKGQNKQKSTLRPRISSILFITTCSLLCKYYSF